LAGEDKRYTDWIRTQPCAACGTVLAIDPHHALYGTTYSPDEPRPPKAIEGARKGAAQRSHDYFAIPMCLKCHEPGIHQLRGFFAGWSRTQANGWEEEQVRAHRNRYAMQEPERLSAPGALRVRGVDMARETAAERERRRIAAWLRDKAGARHLKVNEAAVLTDAASELEQQTGGEF
jgi:hypothetical protein